MYRVFYFKLYGRLSHESMILLKNFSNESCMVWRRTQDENVDLTLSDLVKIRSRSLLFF